MNVQVLATTEGQPNVGYIAQIRLIPADQVIYIASPEEITVNAPQEVPILTVTENAHIVQLPVLPMRATYVETNEHNPDGTLYKPTITADMFASNDASLFLNQYGRRRFVAIMLDHYGNTIIVGEPQNGLRISYTKNKTAQRSIQLTLSSQYSHPINEYSPELNGIVIPWSSTDTLSGSSIGSLLQQLQEQIQNQIQLTPIAATALSPGGVQLTKNGLSVNLSALFGIQIDTYYVPVAHDNQTQFALRSDILPERIVAILVNGAEQHNSDYEIAVSSLIWLGEFPIQTTDHLAVKFISLTT